LKWNPGDTALVRKVADRVDEISEGIVLLVSALGSHQALPIGAAVASVSGHAAPAEAPR
jgi:hypothetical protein